MSDDSIVPVKDQKGGLLSVISSEPIDDYGDLELSPAAKENLARLVLNVKAGVVSLVPLVCKGPSVCPFISKCPIYKADKENASYPIGKQCIAEGSIAREKFMDYIEEFELKEHDVENSPTIRAMLSRLVELDIFDVRANAVLSGMADAKDATLLIEQNIAFDPNTEETVTQLQEHPAWRIKDRIHKQRQELLHVLLATPRGETWKKQALKERSQTDYLTQSRQLQEKLDLLTEVILEKEKEKK